MARIPIKSAPVERLTFKNINDNFIELYDSPAIKINFNSDITISGPAGPANSFLWGDDLNIGGTADSGTVLQLAQGYVQPKVYLNFPADTVNASKISGSPVDVPGLCLNQTIGGGDQVGSRSLLSLNTTVLSDPGTESGNDFYPNVLSTMVVEANMGGDGVTARGNVYTLGGQLTLNNNATHIASAYGLEIDISAQSGTSVNLKAGILVSSYNSDAVHGSVIDAGYWLNKQATSDGFNVGLLVGDTETNHFPITSSGRIISIGSGGGTCAYGIDLSNATFTTAAFKSTGLTVNGSGDISFTGVLGVTSGLTLNSGGNGTMLLVTTSGGSNANRPELIAATAGNQVIYGVSGSDTNINVFLRSKGTGSVVTGAGAPATNATDGFIYIPACAGTPTGTPTAVSGRVPLVVDSTNNKLYFYSGGAWRDAGP